MVAQQLERIHVQGIAPDDSFHEFDLKVQRPRLLAGRSFLSRTTFDRHTTVAIVVEQPKHVKEGKATFLTPFDRGQPARVAATISLTLVSLHGRFWQTGAAV